MAVAAPGRCADRDENRLGPVHRGGQIAGEGQAAGLDVFRHKLFEAGFVDRHPAVAQGRELCGVGLDHRDLGAELGETGAGHQADVAAADHRDTHVFVSLARMMR